MTTLLKEVHRFNAIPNKTLMAFFKEIEKILKFLWRHTRPQVVKTILSKKNKDDDIILPDFKIYYSNIIIKQYGIDKKWTYR
jgi:ubiquinone/menaquinone biosynthesis C-methylase UbiE